MSIYRAWVAGWLWSPMDAGRGGGGQEGCDADVGVGGVRGGGERGEDKACGDAGVSFIICESGLERTEHVGRDGRRFGEGGNSGDGVGWGRGLCAE